MESDGLAHEESGFPPPPTPRPISIAGVSPELPSPAGGSQLFGHGASGLSSQQAGQDLKAETRQETAGATTGAEAPAHHGSAKPLLFRSVSASGASGDGRADAPRAAGAGQSRGAPYAAGGVEGAVCSSSSDPTLAGPKDGGDSGGVAKVRSAGTRHPRRATVDGAASGRPHRRDALTSVGSPDATRSQRRRSGARQSASLPEHRPCTVVAVAGPLGSADAERCGAGGRALSIGGGVTRAVLGIGRPAPGLWTIAEVSAELWGGVVVRATDLMALPDSEGCCTDGGGGGHGAERARLSAEASEGGGRTSSGADSASPWSRRGGRFIDRPAAARGRALRAMQAARQWATSLVRGVDSARASPGAAATNASPGWRDRTMSRPAPSSDWLCRLAVQLQQLAVPRPVSQAGRRDSACEGGSGTLFRVQRPASPVAVLMRVCRQRGAGSARDGAPAGGGVSVALEFAVLVASTAVGYAGSAAATNGTQAAADAGSGVADTGGGSSPVRVRLVAELAAETAAAGVMFCRHQFHETTGADAETEIEPPDAVTPAGVQWSRLDQPRDAPLSDPARAACSWSAIAASTVVSRSWVMAQQSHHRHGSAVVSAEADLLPSPSRLAGGASAPAAEAGLVALLRLPLSASPPHPGSHDTVPRLCRVSVAVEVTGLHGPAWDIPGSAPGAANEPLGTTVERKGGSLVVVHLHAPMLPPPV